MKLQNGVTLTGCTKDILALVEWLDSWANSNNMKLVVSSGFRSKEANDRAGGSKTSLHLKGQAIDYSFEGVNVFQVSSALWKYFKDNVGPWAKIKQFEMCRGKGKQHFHAGINDAEKYSFTGEYK